jgi:AcrR family transcriptional regulator
MTGTAAPRDTTRERLIEAAGRVFADRGYEHATVREICRRAKANIASVNYHFGGKDGLYAEVFTHGALEALTAYPPDLGLGPEPTPEQELHAFIYSFLCRFLRTEQQAGWHTKLCAREMVLPTIALDRVVDKIIRPLSERLAGIVRRILGGGASAEEARRCALSIVGQCLFYHHGRHVLERLYGPQRHTDHEIRRLAEHITTFSLTAMRGQRAANGRRKS